MITLFVYWLFTIYYYLDDIEKKLLYSIKLMKSTIWYIFTLRVCMIDEYDKIIKDGISVRKKIGTW